MDYVFNFALTFKCICYDFISKILTDTQYMTHDGKINIGWKKLQHQF
jgi:hypothetical protein